jgi:AcrR family transcriptional regulator
MRDKRQKKHNGNGDFPRNRVFEVAAEVFHRKGYDNTSMSDIASAAGLTKAGLYHHISSKESLLYTVLDYGLDLTQAYVLEPLEHISDPLERLKTMIDLHLRLVLQERNLEVTGLLHECKTLSSLDRAKINRRKKEYVRIATNLIAEVTKKYHVKDLNAKLAAYALLGMLNWTYQWYKPSGSNTRQEIVETFQQIFLRGILGSTWAPLPLGQSAAKAAGEGRGS